MTVSVQHRTTECGHVAEVHLVPTDDGFSRVVKATITGSDTRDLAVELEAAGCPDPVGCAAETIWRASWGVAMDAVAEKYLAKAGKR